jgi:hypothetical protein
VDTLFEMFNEDSDWIRLTFRVWTIFP